MTRPTSGSSDRLTDIAARIDTLRRQAERAEMRDLRMLRPTRLDTRSLTQLTEVMRTNPAAVTGVNLPAAFPPDLLLPDARRPGVDKLLTILILIRDVLVFFPVIFTWSHLHEAVDAHQKFNKPGESFLVGWERGFDGESATLGAAARDVVICLLLLIFVMVTAHLLVAWAAVRNSRADLRDALAHELALATLQLGLAPATPRVLAPGPPDPMPYAPAPPPVPVEQLNRLVTAIATASAKLADALDRHRENVAAAMGANPGTPMGEALDRWTRAATSLVELGTGLQAPGALVAELARIRTDMADDEAQTRDAVGRLVRQLEEATAASTAEATQHGIVANEVVKATEHVGHALEALGDRYETIDRVTNQFRELLIWLERRLNDGGGYRPSPGSPGFGPPAYHPRTGTWDNPPAFGGEPGGGNAQPPMTGYGQPPDPGGNPGPADTQ